MMNILLYIFKKCQITSSRNLSCHYHWWLTVWCYWYDYRGTVLHGLKSDHERISFRKQNRERTYQKHLSYLERDPLKYDQSTLYKYPFRV